VFFGTVLAGDRMRACVSLYFRSLVSLPAGGGPCLHDCLSVWLLLLCVVFPIARFFVPRFVWVHVYSCGDDLICFHHYIFASRHRHSSMLFLFLTLYDCIARQVTWLRARRSELPSAYPPLDLAESRRMLRSSIVRRLA